MGEILEVVASENEGENIDFSFKLMFNYYYFRDRERALPPETITRVLGTPKYRMSIGPALPAIMAKYDIVHGCHNTFPQVPKQADCGACQL